MGHFNIQSDGDEAAQLPTCRPRSPVVVRVCAYKRGGVFNCIKSQLIGPAEQMLVCSR